MAVLPARSLIERALVVCEFGRDMSAKKPVDPSPERLARAERQRLANEDGARAMADAERRAVEVRKNMQRLRTLREAKEADQDRVRASLPQPTRKRRSRRTVE